METYTLITGASSGMGAVCAKRFSSTHKLIMASENMEALQQVLSECDYPENHILWHCNFAEERGQILESLRSLLVEHDAVIDQYVHFAGMTQILPFKDFDNAAVDRIFNVNFFSIVEVLRTLLKRYNKKALRNVVLISALVSQRGNIGNSIYAASKGAINSLVYTLSQELAPSVRINALMPGALETPMTRNLNAEYKQAMADATPLGLGEMDDVVNYVEFLLSDKARWITGQTIYVDGGLSTKC